MSLAENKAIVRQLTNAFNEGDLDVVDELATSDFVLHHPLGEDVHGPAGLRSFFATFRQAMPDMRHAIQQILAEGDVVAVQLPLTATFSQPFMSIPPNHAAIQTTAVHLWRLRDGLVVEAWFTLDTLGLMRQMGALPTVKS